MPESCLKDLDTIKEIISNLLSRKPDEPELLVDRFKKLMKDEIFNLLWYCLSCFSKVSFQLADHRIYLLQSIIEFI